MALLIRVILTGEWSDTSWFGKLIDSLARTLRGRLQQRQRRRLNAGFSHTAGQSALGSRRIVNPITSSDVRPAFNRRPVSRFGPVFITLARFIAAPAGAAQSDCGMTRGIGFLAPGFTKRAQHRSTALRHPFEGLSHGIGAPPVGIQERPAADGVVHPAGPPYAVRTECQV